ncbi:Hsp20 family protein [Marivibrio halodurans]|uniref:Hsp20 family protein n=1 Tax=Marivibrio halodurans TaxID=2039722 RepID=A0A8J7V447_9PROT|nr:Hsp20 family protein [Marivibrio halodurans]MBP5859050.1 Hsp20 family protein [Marivibrio halodurans]
MSRMTLLNSPLMLGFEHVERTLDRVAKMSAEGYPPYNIEQLSDTRLRITLAVAGFAEGDLAVHRDGDQLIVTGRQQDRSEEEGRVFLHRGIAARQFQRSFVLADGIEVEGAALADGLLHIDLSRPLPESRVQSIPITKGGAAGKTLDIERD